ncbi:MAG: toxin-antitoxin system HicB family antitoxin [Ilumatobacteraceae bacterium]
MTSRPPSLHQSTVRLPHDLAIEAATVARARGVSLNQLIIQSLRVEIDRSRDDKDFRSRLALLIEQDKEILRRLAE